MSLNSWDAKLHTASFRGVPFQQLAEGTFITASRDEDAFAKGVGSDGHVIRSRNNNRSGSITVTLQASSPTNDILSGIAKQDELTGTGVGPFFIKDTAGRTVLTAANAWIRKMPEVQVAKEATDMNREWVFDVDYLDVFVGGFSL